MKQQRKNTNNSRKSRIPRALSAMTQYRFRRSSGTLLGMNSFAGFTNPSGSTVYGQGLGIAFSLGNTYFYGSTGSNFTTSLPSVTEFVNLFDRFRIEKVTVRMVPSFNVLGSQATAVGSYTGQTLPIVQEARDFDDANAPTSNGDLLQRNDVKIVRFETERNLSLKPKASMSGALGAGGVGSSIQSSQDYWLDTTAAGQDTLMFGLKYWSESMATSAGYQLGYLMVYIEYDLVFATPR